MVYQQAKRLVQAIEETAARLQGFPIMLEWRKDPYLGMLQYLQDPEIVLLSKTSKPIQEPLKNAILKIRQIAQITARPDIDLEGRIFTLRLVDDPFGITRPTKKTNH